jgi:hypothetical protein
MSNRAAIPSSFGRPAKGVVSKGSAEIALKVDFEAVGGPA